MYCYKFTNVCPSESHGSWLSFHQSPKQSHAEDHTGQIEAASGDHCRRTRRFQSRKEHHRADFLAKNPSWEISPAPASPLACLYRLQEGLRCGWHAVLLATMKQYNTSANLSESSNTSMTRQPVQFSSTAAYETGSNNSWSPTGMSTLTHPLQHISGKDRDKRLRRSRRHFVHWRKSSHQSSLCWWHRWLSRRGRRIGKFSWASRRSLHNLWHSDQC